MKIEGDHAMDFLTAEANQIEEKKKELADLKEKQRQLAEEKRQKEK